MADKKISELDDGGDIEDTDLVPVARGADNAKVVVGTMAAEDAADYTNSAGLAAGYQPLDADLTAVAALGTTGFAARTASDTWALRSMANAIGITWTNPAGVAGDPTPAFSGLATQFIPAAAMRPSAAGGCAPLALVASGANQPDISSLNFDPSTDEFAQFSFRFPKKWNAGTITFAPVWSHPAAVTNFGVSWGLQAVSIADNEAMAVAFGSAQTSLDTGGTTDTQYIGPTSSAITIGGTPIAGEVVYFRVYRDADDATNDTLAVDARLHGIMIFYGINTLDDT